MRAIRWVSFSHCDLTGPKDKRVDNLPFEDILLWEGSPDREISVEILIDSTFNLRYESIGLEIDMDKTELVRVYAEDAWTLVSSDGTLRSSCVDEDVAWGDCVDSGWENAERIYHSIDFEERKDWAEGVVKNPKYSAIVFREDDDTVDFDELELVAAFFNLPIVSITTDDRAVLE